MSRGSADADLSAAVSCGDVALAKMALDAGASPDAPMLDWPFAEKPLALHAALRRSDAEMAELLISKGADINAMSLDGKPCSAWICGDACSLVWLAAGGDPWEVHGHSGGKLAMAHRAARGGSAEVWAAICAALPLGGDPCVAGIDPSGFGKSTDVGLEAVKWDNVAAVAALGAAGWIPSAHHVLEPAVSWCCSSSPRMNSRHMKMAKALFAIGAPQLSEEELSRKAWIFGVPKAEEALAAFGEAWRDVQEKALRSHTRRGSRRPAGGRRL